MVLLFLWCAVGFERFPAWASCCRAFWWGFVFPVSGMGFVPCWCTWAGYDLGSGVWVPAGLGSERDPASWSFDPCKVHWVFSDLGLSPCLRGASCGVVRLAHIDFLGTRADLFPWGPVCLLGILVYLVLFPGILLFGD